MADDATPTPDDDVAAPDGADPDDAAAPEEVPVAKRGEIPTELVERLGTALGDGIVEAEDNFADYVVRLEASWWRRAAEVARDELDCDYLSFVSGVDWAPTPREGDEKTPSAPPQPQETASGVAGGDTRFQVFAHVQSTRRHWGVTFKVDVDEANPSVASWVPVYPGADWHEREAWEMYGIDFDGHPGLRKLYLPTGFEGFPLRKDFPLLARDVKPWPGLVDVEDMPPTSGEEGDDEAGAGEPAAIAGGDEGGE